MNLPTPGEDPPLDVLLQGICRAAALPDLLSYQPPRGAPRHRRAGAKWLRRFGLACDEEEVLLCSGSQHALFLCLSLLCEPGATVLTEELTYPGFVAAAQALHLNVQGIELDEQGPTPDGLRAATKRTRSRVLCLTPTCQNPTTRTASRERRLALLTVAEQLDLQIIEDDLLSPLVLDAPPPLASLAPERVFFIASLSKLMAGGLRVAFLRPPVGVYERASERLAAIGWTTSPLNAELAKALLDSVETEVALERRRLALGRRAASVRPCHAGGTFCSRWLISLDWFGGAGAFDSGAPSKPRPQWREKARSTA